MSEVQIRQYCNVAGLAVLVYDQILTWEQELQYIWLDSEIFLKSSFFLSRYLAPTIQIINIIHSSPPVLERRRGKCFPWFAFQIFSTCMLLWNMEVVMMIRVYALYDRARLMGTLLVLWFTFSRILNFWNGIDAMENMEADRFCIIKKTPDGSKWFSLTIIVNQFLLWALTYYKYRDAVKEGWSRHPIVRVVMRDNSWVFITFTGILVSLLPYSFYVQQVGHIIFSLFNCIISIMSCRLILNMRSIKGTGNDTDSQMELTTIILDEEHSLGYQ
ncbi:hypothetical protein P691DRAFT_712088 [Macrolepiota fuliginosa MF-IS2]|uniref:DUF6533 domain-containing protein n=1 Tax=Macrolepiota fuliginosa MF-IS2 TaxID=1400762 RepID=A0A9P5X4J2_9AGAR|nr:hypothetical protein P691DRAFT_712088 [Macrolepiota fuliginosa MF-IS2]